MSLTALSAATIACLASLLALLACALSVRSSRSASREAAKLRSMNSMQGELAEMHEALARISVVTKRLAGRQAVWDSRAKPAEPDLQSVTDKNELRRRVGLVPGQPAPHK